MRGEEITEADDPLTEEEVLQAQVDLARHVSQTRLNLVSNSPKLKRRDEPRRLMLHGPEACTAARSAKPSPPPSQGHADGNVPEEEGGTLTRLSLRSPSSQDAQPASLQLRKINLSGPEQQVESLP